ncbi:family 31 glycosyl hydrolase [Xylariomycetidae sp. FL0641]|nr:family 31 glycosyl hydrolase [Xylariomycetidae sp. FL0641]
MASLLFMAASAAALATRDSPSDETLAACPGYKASNVQTTASGLTADLKLAGEACNAYGEDLEDLVLEVSYDTDTRLHVKIQDAGNDVYQVPESVFPRPPGGGGGGEASSALRFDYAADPFSFRVARAGSGEVLFDTSAAGLVFESQYLRLRTKLPDRPSLYGLGEHSDPFMLNTTGYVRTFWSQDAYAVPGGANLYGNHPVYYEHRDSGTHGVFLLNSNGMDVMINNTEESGQYLEYNTLGGVLDFYFVSGPSPIEVSQQYAEIVGKPTMMPYWGFGFHQCRYGYRDVYELAGVVYNYSQADIPLETMWTDIDYMYLRRTFSLDPERFNIKLMRQLIDYLHAHDQHYVVMVDPAVAYQEYPPALARGVEANAFLRRGNGSVYQGVVWPGVTAFPDWFAANTSAWWSDEFARFFAPADGLDIDALWIDMNEPSNFPCYFPCADPAKYAVGYPPDPPPVRSPPMPLPGFPCDFQPNCTDEPRSSSAALPATGTGTTLELRGNGIPKVNHHNLILPRQQGGETGQQLGLAGRDLLFPKYAIHNKAAYLDSWNAGRGGLSNKTVNTDLIHQNGLAMYDTHNLYGSLMSAASHAAMLRRRPGLRAMVITRSTFAGAGAKVGHWLGDNLSDWPHYRLAVRSMLSFAALYQIPMVGADVCGFDGNTTEQLCARWTALGAFAPFARNHNGYESAPQELYRWPATAAAARKYLGIRYRLLDYAYTALARQAGDGTPMVRPMVFAYPGDAAARALDLQYFYGPGLLVAPVTQEDSTEVDVYLPDDVFYDWHTRARVVGAGGFVRVAGQGWTDLPLFLRGGVVVPLRAAAANTTTALRRQPFEILVPVGRDGAARGELYVDDGVSLVQDRTTEATFAYADGVLKVGGSFGYGDGVRIARITFLGLGGDGGKLETAPVCRVAGEVVGDVEMDPESDALSILVDRPLTEAFEVEVEL